MRCLFGFLCVWTLGLVPLAGCSEGGGTFECGDPGLQLTAEGHEVVYNRALCQGDAMVDSYLVVYDVQTQGRAHRPVWAAAFDVSSDGEVIVYQTDMIPGQSTLLEIYDRGSGNTTSVDVAELGPFLYPTVPRISGDGRVAAFTIQYQGFDYAIFLYDRVTEQIQQATTGPNAASPSLSNDGQFLAYQTNPDQNEEFGIEVDAELLYSEIRVLDRSSGQSTLVSVNSDGEPADANSFEPFISGDGRFVVFRSSGRNLVTPPPPSSSTRRIAEVYLHDRETGTTSLISRDADSGGPSGGTTSTAVPADWTIVTTHGISTGGQFVVYQSNAESIVPLDSQAGRHDIYRYDAEIDRTTRVSVNSLGESANGGSTYTSISDDGRLIAFLTNSTNLHPNDVDSDLDIYLHDVSTGETTWVSRD